MIPRIRESTPVPALYLQFLQTLQARGFTGDINPDYANRTVLSTDNSIYQIFPQGVVYPKNNQDIVLLAELCNTEEFSSIVVSPRGGGTGINGQSLTNGLVVDLSKHMNQILEINPQEGWARVQAGVVKDQLNKALKPHGLFFAPELSTSNRATIGGMINTDAAGQGSCLYGKTRDHVLELNTVFLDGSQWTSHPINDEELTAITERQDKIGLIHRLLNNIEKEHRQKIADIFPKLNRCLTGYDLAHIRNSEGQFDLNSILCGSEGTLGFITEAKLNVLPIPKHSALLIVNYSDFQSSLYDAKRLMAFEPSSIETIDGKILNLAVNDMVWHQVAEFFPGGNQTAIQGVNLVEFTADNMESLKKSLQNCASALQREPSQPKDYLSHSLAIGSQAVNRLWTMRKRAVGLLGNMQGEARPVPFVEDVAVPPEKLADFIRDFREILDSYHLDYGMFGHVDAGVLHVRPVLNMKETEHAKLLRPISDQVVEKVKHYGGLLWGEHGKGIRSEYVPKFFGELYPQLQRIKYAFDSHNQLNPGKIATPDSNSDLLKIDVVPTRGAHDRQISPQNWDSFSEGLYCNGNGACFSWDTTEAMCPSWKATRQRIHSPKGRAELLREWLKQLSDRNVNIAELTRFRYGLSWYVMSFPARLFNSIRKWLGVYDFSHAVHESMNECLACKSCTGQCPIKVDVPEFRSKFLTIYYMRYLRPIKDYIVGSLEFSLPLMAQIPNIYNSFASNAWAKKLLSKTIGLEDAPLLSKITLTNIMRQHNVEFATPFHIARLNDAKKNRAVVIVQDVFTSHFEAELIQDTIILLKKLQFIPLIAPYQANGKPLHVHGFRNLFERTARKNCRNLKRITEIGVPLIGIDPSMTLCYRSEYTSVLNTDEIPEVLLIQEWLSRKTDGLQKMAVNFEPNHFSLLPHCTERTNAIDSLKDWRMIFKALGQELAIVDAGCCGMAGTYGHDSAHKKTSSAIYQLSWAEPVKNRPNLIATGYSCRSQVKRLEQVQLLHPVQALLKQWQDSNVENQQETTIEQTAYIQKTELELTES